MKKLFKDCYLVNKRKHKHTKKSKSLNILKTNLEINLDKAFDKVKYIKTVSKL